MGVNSPWCDRLRVQWGPWWGRGVDLHVLEFALYVLVCCE